MPDPHHHRNIGIAAHIDAGKTTLSERILFYTGKIHRMGEVGERNGGATMDYMDLEREHGITITAAAITCFWENHQINLIDTPGHVDFTVEVERSIRVLDGAVLVLCAVAGVQAQSITVDRQMRRYGVPRILFINKLDRLGADPQRAIAAIRDKLGLNPIVLHLPMGLEQDFAGVIDLIAMEALYFEGDYGEQVGRQPIPEFLLAEAQTAREALLDQVSLLSDEVTEKLISGEAVPPELIIATLRQATLSHACVPVLMGSALKNKGVQPLLEGVIRYLPSPLDRGAVPAIALETDAPLAIVPDPKAPVVALAFKLLETAYGELTYARLYAGTLTTGTRLLNSRTRHKLRINRMVRLEADQLRELDTAQPGEIVGLVGVACASGDTLSDPDRPVSLEGIQVPDPVITRSISAAHQSDLEQLETLLARFTREDPTLKVSTDPDSQKLLLSGMGELHLSIYLERLEREHNLAVKVGQPAVAYRETLTTAAAFDYTFERELPKSRLTARVVGRLDPCPEPFLFEDQTESLPAVLVTACREGFQDGLNTGWLKGYPVVGVKVTLEAASTAIPTTPESAFRFAARGGFEQGFAQAAPVLLEPIMLLEVAVPETFVGAIQHYLLSHRGLVLSTEAGSQEVIVRSQVPLAEMFGYATELRSLSHGMATFSMEFLNYQPLPTALLDTIA